MIAWLVEALIASAALMALVLVIRAPVRRTFGPGIAYALWALPVVRLLLPPLVMPSWLTWRAASAPRIAQQAQQTITVYVIEPIAGSAAAPDKFLPSLGAAAFILWAIGAMAFVLWHASNHMRFCRRMLESRIHSSLEGDVEVIETEAASGPLAFGIFRRYVAFPPDFAERYDADERELALAHELGHHARGDLIANWVALFVLALHWFNPLAWRAFRAFRADQEMANDARVLADRSAIDRHTYACAIVKAAHGGAVSAACHLHTVQDLKGRLKMLATGRRSRVRLTVGAATVGALTIGGLLATASGTPAIASVRKRVETVTRVDFTRVEAALRAVPATPAAPEGAAPPAPPEHAAPVAVVQPPAPPVPPATPATPAVPYSDVPGTVVVTTDKDGKQAIKHVRYVRLGRNGKVMTEDYRDIADVPEVSSANCGGDGERPTVIHKVESGRQKIVICEDRINRMAARAERQVGDARQIERNAKLAALSGLRASRASIAANASMGVEARTAALQGMDDAIRELENDTDD